MVAVALRRAAPANAGGDAGAANTGSGSVTAYDGGRTGIPITRGSPAC